MNDWPPTSLGARVKEVILEYVDLPDRVATALTKDIVTIIEDWIEK